MSTHNNRGEGLLNPSHIKIKARHVGGKAKERNFPEGRSSCVTPTGASNTHTVRCRLMPGYMGRNHTIPNLRNFRPFARLIRALPVLPLLSPEQELTGKGVGKLKQRLAPLHRRKSDAVDGRFRRRSRNLSSAQRKSASSGQEPSLARRSSTTPVASRPSTTSNTSTAREGVPRSRTSCSSETATDPGADQAQLKVSF